MSSNKKKHNAKILLTASLINALELYDYVLYGVMVPIISSQFFPSDGSVLPITLGYVSFMIAFMVAPLSSIFWGWLGDKFGRLTLLKRTVILMGVPSLGIALLPTYQQIGIASSLLVILFRVIQGVSVSGEVFGVKIFAMEHLGSKFYGRASGVISAGGAVGILFAMFMGFLTFKLSEYPNIWRIPFFIGGSLCLLNFVIRRHLTESQAFKHLSTTRHNTTFLEVLKNNTSNSITVFVLGAILGILSYFLHVFVNPFLVDIGMDNSFAYCLTIIALVCTIFASVFIGIYSDKIGHIDRFLIKYMRIMILSFIPTYFALLFGGVLLQVAAFVILGTVLGIYATLSAVVMYKAFPIDSRCRGVLFNYALAVALFGGATPFTLSMLANINPLLPGLAVFVAFCFFYYLFYITYFDKEDR